MITQKELKGLVSYNPISGELTWLERSKKQINDDHQRSAWNSKHKDKVAGGSLCSSGYKRIVLLNRCYRQHRIIWLYVNGEEPVSVDHINHDKTDNRITNLRSANHVINSHNMPKSKANKSGVVGVHWCQTKIKWCAEIKCKGKKISLGYFLSFFEAVCARKSANIKYKFHENHGK